MSFVDQSEQLLGVVRETIRLSVHTKEGKFVSAPFLTRVVQRAVYVCAWLACCMLSCLVKSKVRRFSFYCD